MTPLTRDSLTESKEREPKFYLRSSVLDSNRLRLFRNRNFLNWFLPGYCGSRDELRYLAPQQEVSDHRIRALPVGVAW